MPRTTQILTVVSLLSLVFVSFYVYQQRVQTIYRGVKRKDVLEAIIDQWAASAAASSTPLGAEWQCPSDAQCVVALDEKGHVTQHQGQLLPSLRTDAVQEKLAQAMHSPRAAEGMYVYIPDESSSSGTSALYLHSHKGGGAVAMAMPCQCRTNPNNNNTRK